MREFNAKISEQTAEEPSRPIFHSKTADKASSKAKIDEDGFDHEYVSDHDDHDDDDDEGGVRRSKSHGLNELQKRCMIQRLQQQILIDMHEKEELLAKQIEEIRNRGWNRNVKYST